MDVRFVDVANDVVVMLAMMVVDSLCMVSSRLTRSVGRGGCGGLSCRGGVVRRGSGLGHSGRYCEGHRRERDKDKFHLFLLLFLPAVAQSGAAPEVA